MSSKPGYGWYAEEHIGRFRWIVPTLRVLPVPVRRSASVIKSDNSLTSCPEDNTSQSVLELTRSAGCLALLQSLFLSKLSDEQKMGWGRAGGEVPSVTSVSSVPDTSG